MNVHTLEESAAAGFILNDSGRGFQVRMGSRDDLPGPWRVTQRSQQLGQMPQPVNEQIAGETTLLPGLPARLGQPAGLVLAAQRQQGPASQGASALGVEPVARFLEVSFGQGQQFQGIPPFALFDANPGEVVAGHGGEKGRLMGQSQVQRFPI